MQRWSLRKILIWLIITVGAFALPWQQVLMEFALPVALKDMSTDPVKREQQLRSAVSRLDRLGNVFPYGRGAVYVELAAIEAGRGQHRAAEQLLTRGLQFEPQPVGVRLALVRSTLLAGGHDTRERASAYLHDISRFAEPGEAGAIIEMATQLGLPQPWSEYTPPKAVLDKPVSILALGNIPPRTIESITRKLEQAFGATVVVHSDPGFQPTTKNRLGWKNSLQFDVDDVENTVASEYRHTLDSNVYGTRLVIVDFDIYAFGLNYIYATLARNGSSIISLNRFQDENEDLVRYRATKQALTSLLDQLGAGRPSHSSCVNANNIGGASFDHKTDVICSETLLAVASKQTSRMRTSQSAAP